MTTSARTTVGSIRRELGLPEDATIVLVVGTVEPRKAQTRIAQAIERLRSRHPDVLCVMVGDQPTGYSEGLHRYVTAAGLEDHIRIIPLVSDPFPWLRAADLFLCASDIESLPRSILEAMAFGLPVVACRIFGIPELIDPRPHRVPVRAEGSRGAHR